MAMTQGDAVFFAVSEVFPNVDAVPSTTTWSDAQKEAVHNEVFARFKNGECLHSNKSISDAELMKYIPGLVNNWVRKDKRLNGGVVYTAKRPGSRSGSGDESIKAMRALLSVTTDSAVKAQIQSAIDERLAQLKPEPTINAAALPESLRHLVK